MDQNQYQQFLSEIGSQNCLIHELQWVMEHYPESVLFFMDHSVKGFLCSNTDLNDFCWGYIPEVEEKEKKRE